MSVIMRYYNNEDQIDAINWTRVEFDCTQCGAVVMRWRGVATEPSCDECGAQYNASGQRLRDDWRGNRSTWDENVGDLEGFEEQQLRAEL